MVSFIRKLRENKQRNVLYLTVPKEYVSLLRANADYKVSLEEVVLESEVPA